MRGVRYVMRRDENPVWILSLRSVFRKRHRLHITDGAAEIGQPMHIAVADAGGNLVAHVCMDDARIGSIDISIKKAYTSRAFDIAKDLATHSQSGGQFFGIHASNDGP